MRNEVASLNEGNARRKKLFLSSARVRNQEREREDKW